MIGAMAGPTKEASAKRPKALPLCSAPHKSAMKPPTFETAPAAKAPPKNRKARREPMLRDNAVPACHPTYGIHETMKIRFRP